MSGQAVARDAGGAHGPISTHRSHLRLDTKGVQAFLSFPIHLNQAGGVPEVVGLVVSRRWGRSKREFC